MAPRREAFLDHVKEPGEYPNQQEAERAAVKDLAARSGATLATARWDTGSVLAAVAASAGPELLTRILRQLPTGYALLFGRAELTPAA